MMRRRGERLAGLSIALLFAFASPAGAQLTVSAQPVGVRPVGAQPLGPLAGADFLSEGMWSLPTVATFDDADLFGVCRPPTDYKVDVNWGDNSVAGAQPLELPPQAIYKMVKPAPGRCEYGIEGNSVYKRPGDHPYSVTVCRRGVTCAATTATGSSYARITEAPFTGAVLSNLSSDLSPTATRSFYGPIAVISDNNRYTNAVDFQADINWGEPSRSDPKPVVLGSDGSFVVIGQHKYGQSGPQNVSVTVNRSYGKRRRLVGTRQANTTTRMFTGQVVVDAAPPPPPVCPDGRPEPCPPPPTIGMSVPGTATLASLGDKGLPISLDIPKELQYGVIVELRGPGRPPGKLIASTVLRLPPHSGQTTLMRRWVFHKARCRLKARAYGVRIPPRTGFPAVRRQVILRGTTPKNCPLPGG